MATRGLRAWSVLACLLAPGLALAQSMLLRESDVALMQGYPVARVASGDLDGDGLMDLAGISYIDFPDAYTQDKLLIQRQVPGNPSTFRDAQSFPVTAPQDVLVSDLDADGDPDIAVVQDAPDDALAIWINQGGVQAGTPGQMQRLALAIAGDLALRVRALDLDANPSTPPALLLLRGTGRDALLLDNHLHLGIPGLTLRQSLPHPAAVGVAVADIDGNGYPDLLVHGDGCRLWLHQGPAAPQPYALAPAEPCGAGMVHAALIETVAPGSYRLALARSDGDSWVRVSPGGTVSLPLGSGAAGITREFALLDANGDGDPDLLAARANENAAAPAQRGSPVYRRIGDAFEGTLQTVQPAWAALPLAPGATAVVLAHPLGGSALWRPQPASAPLPVVEFASDHAVLAEPRLAGELVFLPHSAAVLTTTRIDALSDSGVQRSWTTDTGPGRRRVQSDSPLGAPRYSSWSLTLASASPAGTAAIGARNTMAVLVEPREPTPGQCVIEHLYDIMARLLGGPGGGQRGTPTQLDQLRRLRDERLLASAAGNHYAELYTQLQPDLHAALVSDPQFALQLWALKEAFMPAIDNWLDGDGQAPVDASMQGALSDALSRLQAHASGALHEAVARERRALGLDQLQGQPISVLQSRWERSPLFSSGFD